MESWLEAVPAKATFRRALWCAVIEYAKVIHVGFDFLYGVCRMNHRGAFLAFGFILVALPSLASGQSIPVVKTYDDCITLHAAKASSPQAAIILQRACFYKYRYGKNYVASFGTESEYKKLAKIYTPAVCDCIFDKMPGAPLHLPATRVLDGCVTASRKQGDPVPK